MALAATVLEATFLSMFLTSLIGSIENPIVINGDNQGAIALVKNPIIHNRSKHIDIKYHFICEKYANGFIDIVYVSSEDNVADLFTKPFSKKKIRRFWNMLFGER